MASSCAPRTPRGSSFARQGASLLVLLLAHRFAPDASAQPATLRSATNGSVRIETLAWTDAVRLLDTSTVVMIPLGAQSTEHGPHLPLNNDWLLAEYFAKHVAAATRVVVYPTVNYSFYPSFVEYAGSTSLRLETARDMIVDIVRTIGRHGPRRLYVLNTGVSTLRSLAPARDSLAASGIVMVYTDILKVGKEAEDRVRQQEGGTHADELETSMMLYMHPEVVHGMVADIERLRRTPIPAAAR